MATISITATPVAIGDGTKTIVCDPRPDLVYGFGDTAPSNWLAMHQVNEPYVFSSDMGQLWMRTAGGSTQQLTYFVGV